MSPGGNQSWTSPAHEARAERWICCPCRACYTSRSHPHVLGLVPSCVPKMGSGHRATAVRGGGIKPLIHDVFPSVPRTGTHPCPPCHSRSLLELGPVSVPSCHGQSSGVSRAGTPLCAPRHTWSVTVSLSSWSPHHKEDPSVS